MRSTKKKAIVSRSTQAVYACGKIWTKESLEKFRKYQTEYNTNKYRAFVFRLIKVKEADMIEYLESKENGTDYIRTLIRKDMIAQNYQPSEKAKEIMALDEFDNLSKKDKRDLEKAIIKEENEE